MACGGKSLHAYEETCVVSSSAGTANKLVVILNGRCAIKHRRQISDRIKACTARTIAEFNALDVFGIFLCPIHKIPNRSLCIGILTRADAISAVRTGNGGIGNKHELLLLCIVICIGTVHIEQLRSIPRSDGCSSLVAGRYLNITGRTGERILVNYDTIDIRISRCREAACIVGDSLGHGHLVRSDGLLLIFSVRRNVGMSRGLNPYDRCLIVLNVLLRIDQIVPNRCHAGRQASLVDQSCGNVNGGIDTAHKESGVAIYETVSGGKCQITVNSVRISIYVYVTHGRNVCINANNLARGSLVHFRIIESRRTKSLEAALATTGRLDFSVEKALPVFHLGKKLISCYSVDNSILVNKSRCTRLAERHVCKAKHLHVTKEHICVIAGLNIVIVDCILVISVSAENVIGVFFLERCGISRILVAEKNNGMGRHLHVNNGGRRRGRCRIDTSAQISLRNSQGFVGFIFGNGNIRYRPGCALFVTHLITLENIILMTETINIERINIVSRVFGNSFQSRSVIVLSYLVNARDLGSNIAKCFKAAVPNLVKVLGHRHDRVDVLIIHKNTGTKRFIALVIGNLCPFSAVRTADITLESHISGYSDQILGQCKHAVFIGIKRA